MLPAARISAAIEIMDGLLTAWQRLDSIPADALLHKYFRTRRYIGSKDRGAISQLIYSILRNLGSLRWQVEHAGLTVSGRTLTLAWLKTQPDIGELFNGRQHSPAQPDAKEKAFLSAISDNAGMPEHARLNMPQWLLSKIKDVFGNETETALAALNEEAPVDLRANTLKTTREALLRKLSEHDMEAQILPQLNSGVRLKKRFNAFNLPEFRQGWFEMQDAGSQFAAELCDVKPGQRVIDFCAGAGGKTLALAAAMENKGRLLAWDVSPKRLEELRRRLKRAGVDNVQTHAIGDEQDGFIKRHKSSADRVVVDAPCSGSGTWRRNPDLKWKLQPEDLDELCNLQQRILVSAARLVKPGGKLIFITCSLLREENEMQAERFLSGHPNFAVAAPEKMWDKKQVLPFGIHASGQPYIRLSPHQDGCDGFFVAVFKRQEERATSTQLGLQGP